VNHVSLSYLGAAGWHFRAEQASLLVDPYFTRMSMPAILLSRAVADAELISRYTPPADAILVTHPHVDHLMDVPQAARITGAPMYASPQGSDLLEFLGVPPSQIVPIQAGDSLAIGPFEAEVYDSPHRLIFGDVPYHGPLEHGLKPPLRASDYRMDCQFSFLIAVRGLRLLIASGIQCEPPAEADVLLVGADASREQLGRILGATRPRWVLPNHWDDMFRPLDRPARPMITPPSGLMPGLRRIDLQAFARTVCELHPACEVILPDRFKPYHFPADD
jgi:hypothetical protein